MTPSPTAPCPTLAAIRLDRDGIDALLAAAAEAARARGLTVRGVLHGVGVPGAAECDCAEMALVPLGGGPAFRISQPLGKGATGCRLDPAGLAECAGFLERQIAAEGGDLVILNRFGRGEAEGGGFRDVIAEATAQGITVLTALRPDFAGAWRDFGGEAACELPPELEAITDWLARARSEAAPA